MALEADALHLKADVYTSGGVAAGLILVIVTGWTWLDPVVAIIVAIFILREAWEMLRHAFAPLLDATLPQEDMDIVVEVIDKNCGTEARFHDLRARKAGKTRIVDFHLTLPGEVTIKAAHDLCDRIEQELEERFLHTQVLIHVEPRELKCKPP